MGEAPARSAATAPRHRKPGRFIGAWDPPSEIHPLTLHVTSADTAVLWRHRHNPRNGSTQAATVTHHAGIVNEVTWDEWHRQWAAPHWREQLRLWINAKIAADWAEQAATHPRATPPGANG